VRTRTRATWKCWPTNTDPAGDRALALAVLPHPPRSLASSPDARGWRSLGGNAKRVRDSRLGAGMVCLVRIRNNQSSTGSIVAWLADGSPATVPEWHPNPSRRPCRLQWSSLLRRFFLSLSRLSPWPWLISLYGPSINEGKVPPGPPMTLGSMCDAWRVPPDLVRAPMDIDFLVEEVSCPSSNASGQSEQCWNGGSGSFGVGV
jgi:hypothetical protein